MSVNTHMNKHGWADLRKKWSGCFFRTEASSIVCSYSNCNFVICIYRQSPVKTPDTRQSSNLYVFTKVPHGMEET